jgi:dethiobiotin synthase
VSGTGTDVGKTLVTAAIARLLVRRGVVPALMKPVQTGAVRGDGGRLVAPDLESVRDLASLPPPEEGEERLHAPYLFEPACSPHLAARLAGERIRPERVVEAARRLSARSPFLLVEGAGGALVPLGGGSTMADLAAALSLPVLLVGLGGLGTINHVLLSLEALRWRRIAVAGVVLNETAPVAGEERFLHDDNAAAVEEYGEVAVVARIPFLGSPPDLALLDGAVDASALPALVERIAAGEGATEEDGGAPSFPRPPSLPGASAP